MSKPDTLRLDAATRKRLDKLAEANEWQIAAIEEGVREANRGQLIDQGKLKAKWEKKLAAAVDPSR